MSKVIVDKANVKLMEDGKFEYLYIKEVPIHYAAIQAPKDKFMVNPDSKNKSTREYSMTVFVTDEAREVLEDDVKINKQIFKVGKDKNKKRIVKYPTSKQAGEDKPNYDDVKDLNGLQLTLNEFNNAGSPNTLLVVGADGKPIDDLVGNGSVVTVKCYGYRNQDELLVVAMSIVKVHDLVPYEGNDGSKIIDDEMGIEVDKPVVETKQEAPKEDSKEEDEEDDDSPF